MNKKVTVAVVAAAFLVGGGFGSAGANAEPPPAKTITKTVEVQVPGPEKIVTKEVKVPGPATNTTPKSCLKVMDLAKTVVEAVGQEHTDIGEAATQAGVDGDVPGFLNSMTAAMKTMTAVVTDTTPEMGTAAAACRAGTE